MQAQSPDTILRHGHIFTGDSSSPWVTAVAVRGDKVVAVGDDATVMAKADAHTKVIDLEGRMAMPGINDAHDHVGGAPVGVLLRFPPATARMGRGLSRRSTSWPRS